MMSMMKNFVAGLKRDFWFDMAFVAGGLLVGLTLKWLHQGILPQLLELFS